jgi:hypothetical protein
MGYQLVCETILEWLIYEEIPVQEDVQVFLQTAVPSILHLAYHRH